VGLLLAMALGLTDGEIVGEIEIDSTIGQELQVTGHTSFPI